MVKRLPRPILTRTCRLCVWLVATWAVAACQPAENKPPANLIPPEKMANILTEIHLAEARISRMNIGSLDSSSLVYKRLEGQIFRQFKVDTAAYSKSYTYYAAHPQEMETVYKQVVDQLKKKAKITTHPPS